MNNEKDKPNKGFGTQAAYEHIIISSSRYFSYIGFIVTVSMAAIIIIFTLSGQLQSMLSKLIFYSVFGAFLWLGLWLILISLKYRVIVAGDEITVIPIIMKPNTFCFRDILSVVRKTNPVATLEENSRFMENELVIITTIQGKKLKVESESTDIAYTKFIKAIKAKVDREKLRGFNL